MPCAPGMTKCKRGCLHRWFVSEYRTARLADEQRRDDAVGTYGPGSPEWAEHPAPIVFKDWLIKMRGWSE